MTLNKKVYIWPDFIALLIPSEVPSTDRQQCENQLIAEYPSHYLPVNTRVWNIKILDMNINFFLSLWSGQNWNGLLFRRSMTNVFIHRIIETRSVKDLLSHLIFAPCQTDVVTQGLWATTTSSMFANLQAMRLQSPTLVNESTIFS